MFRSVARADSSDRSPWGDFWFNPAPSRIGGGRTVSADGAMRLTAVYACARVLSESFAVLPFRLYRPRVGGGRQIVTDHWLYRLFAKRPNRWQTPFEWVEMLQGHLALRGNAFNEIIEDGQGGIAELLPLHPDRISLELLGEYEFRYRYTMRNGAVRYLRRDQVWHLRGLSGDGFVGYNPIEIARETFGEALQFQGYSSTFFANNAAPPIWVKFPGKFANDEARKTFRESMQAAGVGSNRGKVMVLDNGMELQALQVNMKDMQFIEARKMKVGEIARMFRVPPHKIGDLDKATFSNIEQQSIEFVTDTLQPYAERWESSIECTLLGADTDLEVEFDMRSQMRGDSAARSAYIHAGVLDGWMTRNEARELEGFDPIEGLDVPLVPVNERDLTDTDPNGETGVGETLPDAAPADSDEEGGADARLAQLLRGNAERMARRIAGGSVPSADVLADALAVPRMHAALWLEMRSATLTEDQITASLVMLGSMQ